MVHFQEQAIEEGCANVITFVVKSDVPADEADLQGPTWVDSANLW